MFSFNNGFQCCILTVGGFSGVVFGFLSCVACGLVAWVCCFVLFVVGLFVIVVWLVLWVGFELLFLLV